MRTIYALLCGAGTLLPLSQFVPWLVEHGLAVRLLVQQASGTRIAAFAWLDVLVAAAVLLVFIRVEGRRLGMSHLWLPTLGLCLVGVSAGLPLFLWLREGHLTRARG